MAGDPGVILPRHLETPAALNEGSQRLLALAPLLLASDNGCNGLVLTIATAIVLPMGSLLRTAAGESEASWKDLARLVYAAATVAALDLCLRAWLPVAHAAVGGHIPLLAIATLVIWQCGAGGTHEPVAARSRWGGIVLLASLPLLVGALRELLAQGSLFAGAAAYFGAGFGVLEMRPLEQPFDGLLLAQRAPFAFLLLALLLAIIQHRRKVGTDAVLR